MGPYLICSSNPNKGPERPTWLLGASEPAEVMGADCAIIGHHEDLALILSEWKSQRAVSGSQVLHLVLGEPALMEFPVPWWPSFPGGVW